MDYKISDLSPHLFWDIDASHVVHIEWQKSANQIIEKVLIYGVLKDWKIINEIYGSDKIKEVSKSIRAMDDVTLNFLCTIYQLNEEDFRCYKLRQYQRSFWE